MSDIKLYYIVSVTYLLFVQFKTNHFLLLNSDSLYKARFYFLGKAKSIETTVDSWKRLHVAVDRLYPDDASFTVMIDGNVGIAKRNSNQLFIGL